jgi:hypothetical protein
MKKLQFKLTHREFLICYQSCHFTLTVLKILKIIHLNYHDTILRNVLQLLKMKCMLISTEGYIS